MKFFPLTILLTTQCLAGGIAYADSFAKAPLYVDVHYGDLNLARIEGAAALYARLRAASHQVCFPLESRELGGAHRYGACVSETLSAAIAKVDQPQLSAYDRVQRGERASTPPQVAKR